MMTTRGADRRRLRPLDSEAGGDGRCHDDDDERCQHGAGVEAAELPHALLPLWFVELHGFLLCLVGTSSTGLRRDLSHETTASFELAENVAVGLDPAATRGGRTCHRDGLDPFATTRGFWLSDPPMNFLHR